jgi:hypothetical protein
VSAVDDVNEETLGVFEACLLCSDPTQLLLDHLGPAGDTSIEDVPYVGQAHADVLTCPKDLQALKVLRRVVAMA